MSQFDNWLWGWQIQIAAERAVGYRGNRCCWLGKEFSWGEVRRRGAPGLRGDAFFRERDAFLARRLRFALEQPGRTKNENHFDAALDSDHGCDAGLLFLALPKSPRDIRH